MEGDRPHAPGGRSLKVPPPSYEFYEFEDYAKLVDAAGKHDPRTLGAVLLGGDAGLRDGEILGLELTDINWQKSLLTVQRQVWRGKVDSPKGGRLRHIPMTEKLGKALRALRHVGGSPRVLLQDGGGELTYKVLRRWLKSAQTIAGLKATGNCHLLRHTFCSLAMTNAPVKAIQELAGHQHIATTMRYMHLSPGAKEQAIRLLENRPTVQAVGDILETGSR